MDILDKNYKDNDFLPVLQKYLKPYLEIKNKKEQKVMGARIRASLLGEPYGEIGKLPPPSERMKFLGVILQNYSEVSTSLETMHMISLMVNQYPKYKSFQKHKITQTKLLRYHIENYLNEVYIFQKRLEAFLKRLIKICLKKGLAKDVLLLEGELRRVSHTLKGINSIRGYHVHDFRFSDRVIEQLESLELYTTLKSPKILEFLKKITYRKARRDWSKIISNNNEALDKLFHQTLKNIQAIIFDNLLPFYK